MIRITDIKDNSQIESVRELFGEYAESLGFSLDFQDFKAEMADFPGHYAPPEGCLLIAYHDNRLAGCVGIRKFADGICEMKRMYVRPALRELGIGRILADKLIDRARQAGYKKMYLDTVDTMTAAIALYRSLGFKEIKSYRFNPLKGAAFFELEL